MGGVQGLITFANWGICFYFVLFQIKEAKKGNVKTYRLE